MNLEMHNELSDVRVLPLKLYCCCDKFVDSCLVCSLLYVPSYVALAALQVGVENAVLSRCSVTGM